MYTLREMFQYREPCVEKSICIPLANVVSFIYAHRAVVFTLHGNIAVRFEISHEDFVEQMNQLLKEKNCPPIRMITGTTNAAGVNLRHISYIDGDKVLTCAGCLEVKDSEFHGPLRTALASYIADGMPGHCSS